MGWSLSVAVRSWNGAKHRWDRLEWLAAIAQLLRGGMVSDWDAVLARASALGIGRNLFLALGWAQRLMDAPGPREPLRRIREDRVVVGLIAQMIELPEQEPAGREVPDLLQQDRVRLRPRERWRDRVRVLGQLLGPPGR